MFSPHDSFWSDSNIHSVASVLLSAFAVSKSDAVRKYFEKCELAG